MKDHASGAKFHEFEKSPKFVGRYVGEVKREKDGKGENQKSGTVIGYQFFDLVNEDDTIVGSSYAIKKALDKAKSGTVFGIEFKGKTENAEGQPVNMFKIREAEDEADVEALLAELEEAEDDK